MSRKGYHDDSCLTRITQIPYALTMQTPPALATPSAPTPASISVQPPALAAEAAASPTAAWRAATATRAELRDQLEALTDERHGYLREIEDHGEVGGQATTGMQQRIGQLDVRIAELDKAIATADAQVARTASVPGAVVTPPQVVRRGPPEETFIVVPIVFLLMLLPMSIAMARRIWRRGSNPVQQQLPSDLGDRLARLEQMGETTALEVERIGEGQRFVTRILTDKADQLAARLPSAS